MISKQSLQISDIATSRLKSIIKNRKNYNLKLRIYIVGGGCNGFQYKFSLDEIVQVDDFFVKKNGVIIVVDPMSLQYLNGSLIDYYEGLEGSRFIVVNPNVKTTCSCGLSFSV